MHGAMTTLGLTPTTQHHEGYPYGDCVRASYAAILDLPWEAVPRFDPAALRPGESQRDRERAWLASMGLALEEATPDELDEVPLGLHLISGLSPRGFGHRCVGMGGHVVWDPHPSRAGLVCVYNLGFLEPIERNKWI